MIPHRDVFIVFGLTAAQAALAAGMLTRRFELSLLLSVLIALPISFVLAIAEFEAIRWLMVKLRR